MPPVKAVRLRPPIGPPSYSREARYDPQSRCLNRIATTPARPPAEKPLEPDAVRQAETSDDIISRGWKVQVGIEFVDRSARKPPEDDLPHHLMIAVVIIEHYARNKCWASLRPSH